MSYDTYPFFASYIPEDEPIAGPILDLIEKQGYRVKRHPDTTMFSDLPTFIRIQISLCDFYIVFMSGKYPDLATYFQESLIASKAGKPMLVVLLDKSEQSTALSRVLSPTLVYNYAAMPDAEKAAAAMVSYVKSKDSAGPEDCEDTTAYLAYKHLLLGIKMYKRCRYEHAVMCFTKAAENGNKEALYHLGICHLKGHGTRQSDTDAFSCLSRAADADIAEAQFYTAILYFEGKGTEKNNSLAIDYLKKAADNNYPEALTMLSGFYYEGFETIVQDKAMAITLLEKAAAQNHQEAIDILKKIKKDSE